MAQKKKTIWQTIDENFNKFKNWRDPMIKKQGLTKYAEAFGWQNPEKTYPKTPYLQREGEKLLENIMKKFKKK